MRQFIITTMLITVFNLPAYADCSNECRLNKFVNYDAIVVCEQICKNTETQQQMVEVLKSVQEELHKQTELLKK